MAESKIENNDFKKTLDIKETLNDTTTSTNEMEDVEKQVVDISNENTSEENDSCEKDFKIIDAINVKEQKKDTHLEDSKEIEKNSPENEKYSEIFSEETVTSNSKQREVADKSEKPKQLDDAVAKAEDAHVASCIPQEEQTLNELLKAVHDNQSSISVRESDTESKDLKKDGNSSDEETKENVDEKSKKESMVKEIVSIETNVPVEDEVKRMRCGSETMNSVEIIEHMEVGIVGPPTTVSELINEELRAESALSTDHKVQDHVAEWVQNSAKAEKLVAEEEDEEEETPIHEVVNEKKNMREKRTRKKKSNDILALPTRKSQRIVSNIIKRSIKCLNKMHAMEGVAGNGKKVDSAEKTREDDSSRASPKVPQSQQNGAALPEETAAAPATVECLRSASIKKEPLCDSESEATTKTTLSSVETQQKSVASRCPKSETEGGGGGGRKRKSTDGQLSSNGNSAPKKSCLEQREQYISSLVGCEKVTAEELAARAEQLRAEVQALDELARAKEMEWNEILSMRKLKEEAYLRIERRRQVMGFMEGNGQLADTLPPASLALGPEWESSGNTTPVSKEKLNFGSKEDLPEESSRDSPAFKKEKTGKQASQRQSTPPKQTGENGRKQAEALSPENRQIGEGRQGAIVDVRSIIADYRLRHPETVPRRGRRMRNSVNVSLGAGGAMVETGHSVDSRPSSTDSCKSNPNMSDPNNSMSFKDVLVQFAKLSQQQGEPVKTPQNYPDVTLHPVAPSPAPPNTPPQQSCSLLHGILTKSQSPRPTTFSPTLARLLTAPERERNAPTAASMPQQSAATQHLLQAYQGSNPVSISDLLSSSKARTEITITPVVNTPVQSHSNNLIHVDDVEEESAVIEDRETRITSGGRDAREDRDSPPRCQGCRERAAQFVCAGCGNQWYCSRECQVAAWDEHSEVCSG
ncbi:titin homolog isoform X1 [Hylaeus volcanicus]|uniref:titin homolog isoform X1 n=1 Tax=Hylaeus volcanicus TaxID=313075 RepID=UPI0023B7F7D6|nr:titin homolog isoform X1 [Hylaeus volcanicus]XP_053986981.1 titin homolog isoform X1 [Hylaeus volcanicus]XP_053986982.1 titin homolog isoform X1 [Hylaeus volcanicus]XP_053986983.1 titin homolog isoform X1 [Hylaeus volcanicus]